MVSIDHECRRCHSQCSGCCSPGRERQRGGEGKKGARADQVARIVSPCRKHSLQFRRAMATKREKKAWSLLAVNCSWSSTWDRSRCHALGLHELGATVARLPTKQETTSLLCDSGTNRRIEATTSACMIEILHSFAIFAPQTLLATEEAIHRTEKKLCILWFLCP